MNGLTRMAQYVVFHFRGQFCTLLYTNISIFDSYDMKTLWFKFGHDIFIGFKMASRYIWDALFQPFYVMKLKTPKFKVLAFEASEDIMTKFKSQGLHIIRIKYWNASGSGSPPSLIPALWNIGILLHKQAKRRTIMHTTVPVLSTRSSILTT